MKKIRPLILAFTVVASALVAWGLFSRPRPKALDAEGFSAARVLQDIEVISRKHHSVAHPEERAEVRAYLASRLHSLGADSVAFYTYDSIVGPKGKHVEYLFDATDVLAEFAPLGAGADSATYLMFVAHADSRYSQPMPRRDTVWSYGAADDGYGLGVALETVNCLLKDRASWKQGVKVLFTDAEEAGMDGMYGIWENNREVFENVGLIVNIEARGPWGPALLFETSPGSSKILDLYSKNARHPFTYSLTTVVYNMMPNFTDFTVVKDHIPGMNFSTVADVNHYHTDLDNFSNVSAATVQHYGSQILPVAHEYVCGEEYSDRSYFVSDTDTVNFTFPLLGIVNMSPELYRIVNIVLLLLFVLLFVIEIRRGSVRLGSSLGAASIVLASAIGVLALGEGAAWVCARIAGARFKLFGVIAGIKFDNAAMIVLTVLLFALTLLVYLRRKGNRDNTLLFGVLVLDALLSAVLLAALGENLMFFIPLFCCVAALLLWRISGWKFWIPLAEAVILLHAFSFLYALAMALTIGAYGAVAMIAFIDIALLIPMSEIYLKD
ncbi:MAG: M28 family peptidase [Bacteroidales bacterium]|nr:M28 family peptidase [Bacteroidales bacterium]